jgi:GAF domain-containing protein
MLDPLHPINETERLQALHGLGILDTPPEERFDHITSKTFHLLSVPFVLLGFVDRERVWYKSSLGIQAREVPRTHSFCSYSILRRGVLHVPDVMEDARFFDNPLVTGDIGIRMFACCPVITPDGLALGALSVSDRKPRTLSREEMRILQVMAGWVEEELFQGSAGGELASDPMDLARRLLKRVEI